AVLGPAVPVVDLLAHVVTGGGLLMAGVQEHRFPGERILGDLVGRGGGRQRECGRSDPREKQRSDRRSFHRRLTRTRAPRRPPPSVVNGPASGGLTPHMTLLGLISHISLNVHK